MANVISVQDSNQVMAALPYPPRPRTAGRWLSQWLGLARVMLTEYRSTWWIHVVFGLIMPMGMLFFIASVGGEISRERAIYMLGGNLTTSVVFGPAMLMINKIGWGRQSRDFDYWAALPLNKLSLLLAMVAVSLTLSLPGLASLYLLGSWLLGLPLTGGLALVGLIPLGALSLVGAGAFIGTYAKDGQTANVMANLLMAFVTFLSPTMIPAEALPLPMRALSSATPIPYVAGAFRSAMAGQFDQGFLINLAVMLVMGLGYLLLVHRKLDWRAQ